MDPTSRLHGWAERRLMAAVLEDAIRTLLLARRSRSPKQIQSEMVWFTSDEQGDPFAFERVCEVLGIEPSYLRRRLFAGTLPPPPTKRATATFPSSIVRHRCSASS
jgi:hypothetical protein